MFTRLFRPRWEHSDPHIRRKALESGSAPPDVLASAARADSDPGVRQCAIERLEDLDLLAELAAGDTPAAVREAALRRQRELLAGPEQQGPPIEARLRALRGLQAPALFSSLAREAQVAEIRAAALGQVQDTALLCSLAIEDPVAAVRRAAVERIDDPAGWERVAQEARNRDKQVSRMARERLEAFRKARAEEETAGQLCVALEALAGSAATAATRAQLHALSVQWDRLETPLPASVKERFAHASRAVTDAIARFESQLGQRRELVAALESLIAALHDKDIQQEPDSDAESGRLQELVERWERLPADTTGNDPLALQFADGVQQLRRQLRQRVEDAERAGRLRSLIAEARAAVDDAADLDEARVKDYRHRWAALRLPQSSQLAAALQQEFDGAVQALRQRLKRQVEQRRQALEEAERFLVELEQALRKGELEHALSLRDRIRHRLKTGRGVDESLRAGLHSRLHALAPQLDTLRDWRHWGSGQSRERLCSEMEALVDTALGATEIAARVRSAREAWKHIDRGEGPAAEALWQRFDAACTRAYAPYQEQRREHMAQLEAQLEQKQALCAELEALERDSDWKNVDWSQMDRCVRGLRQRWHRTGPVPRKAFKALERRYRDALERLENHLGRERDRELRRRRALIASIEALADAQDVRAASDEVKQAQKNWKPTVQADKRTEQALWQEFRAACDAVFGRVNAERDAAARELDVNLQRRTALCEELEAALDDAHMDIRELHRRFAAGADTWQDIGPVPRKTERGVAGRYQALRKRFEQRQQQATRAAAAAELQGIRERASLCARLENALLAGPPADAGRQALVQETAGAWDALEPLDEAHRVPLQKRFELVSRALGGDAGAQQTLQDALGRNLDRRRELCLQIEIEAGVESPAEFAEARMQLQVSRLEDALKHRQDESHAERLRALQIAWYGVGPVAADEWPALEARFARALQALEER